VGPQPQRRGRSAPPQSRRRGAGRGVRLQISQRRARGTRLPLRRRAPPGPAALAPARLDGPCRARSPSPTTTVRRPGWTASWWERRRC
jgi:hypothetical protein